MIEVFDRDGDGASMFSFAVAPLHFSFVTTRPIRSRQFSLPLISTVLCFWMLVFDANHLPSSRLFFCFNFLLEIS